MWGSKPEICRSMFFEDVDLLLVESNAHDTLHKGYLPVFTNVDNTASFLNLASLVMLI